MCRIRDHGVTITDELELAPIGQDGLTDKFAKASGEIETFTIRFLSAVSLGAEFLSFPVGGDQQLWWHRHHSMGLWDCLSNARNCGPGGNLVPAWLRTLSQ